jgi:hypothetical protein
MRLLLKLVLAGLILAATATAATAPTPLKAIGGQPKLPAGKHGAISVVAVGTFDNVLPIVLRNATRNPVSDVKITATAYSNGKLVTTGSDQGSEPATVQPGGLVIAYVYFSHKPPPGATYRFNVSSKPGGSSSLSNVNLRITTARYVDGQLVGIAKNMTKAEISGPLSVYATCFGSKGKVLAMESGFSDADDAAPGAEAPFTLDFTRYGTHPKPACRQILVAMSGYNF